ncbi:PQQ-binding-like beta-propeller repeat protein [Nonomuraea sp. NPDC003709]|uniref:outer membrane protein assembly factor BamB family protein n=1 Tax=Nonomuraea sp. NPDC003709 TaxID=3154450 RepID=UPI00339E1102
MPRRRTVAVLLAMVVVACSTVAADAPRLSIVPVEWRATWSMPVDLDIGGTPTLDFATPLIAVSDRAVAVASRQGSVTVHDPRTGTLMRTIPAASGLPSSVSGVWIVTGTLVVSRGTRVAAGHTLSGYDLLTGVKLWQRTIIVSLQSPTQDAGLYDGPRIMATERGIVVVERSFEPLAIHALDPRTGATTARMTHPRRCHVRGAATVRSVMLLSYCLETRFQLASLDPHSLRYEWTRRLSSFPPPVDGSPGDDEPELGSPPDMDIESGADGYVYVWGGSDALFYAADGRLLSTVREAVEVTDSSRWSLPLFAGSNPTVGEEGELVLHSKWPMPAYLLSLDTVTGHLGGLPIDIPYEFASLAGATRSMAFVYSDIAKTEWISAYTLVRGLPTGPAVFGGIAPQAWPDACALLTERDLRTVGDGYRAVPLGNDRAGTRLPKPPQCNWVPSRDDAAVISLSVDWVSPSNTVARKLFAAEADDVKNSSALPPARFDPSTEGPGFLTYGVTGPNGDSGGTILTVGPVVATLHSSSRLAVRLLSTRLRDNLLTRYRPGVRATPPANTGRWSYPTDSAIATRPVVVHGVVYVGSDDGKVYALDATTGTARWSFQTGESISDELAVTGGVVYAINAAGKTVALDAAGGGKLWIRRTGASLGPVAAERRVYISTDDSEVVALDAGTGKEQWRFRPARTVLEHRLIPGVVPFGPVVAGGVVYVGGDHGMVYALDARSGAQRWRFRPVDPQARMELVVAGRVVYAFSTDGKVYALDAATGTARWSSRLGSRIFDRLVVANGIVHLGGTNGMTYALDAATGKRLWKFRAGHGGQDYEWYLAAARGVTYVSGADSKVYALDASSGATRWSFHVRGGVGSHPAVERGTLYVGGRDGTLHALDAVSGALRWSFETGGFGESTAVVSNGMVYVGSANSILYALPA